MSAYLCAADVCRRLCGAPLWRADLGHFGDLIGRKYTFLVTMSLMGIGTFFIGVLPGFATWGIMAPVVLIGLRLIQGLALGGEYGGAAIYVAEHAPQNNALLLHVMDPDHGNARPVPRASPDPRHPHQHGRRGLRRLGLAHSVPPLGDPARGFALDPAQAQQSPLFKRMVEEGKQSKRPLMEAFGQWDHLKIAILALFGATAGEAVVWYGGQFYALFFLTQTLKVPGVTAQIIIAVALAIGTPCFVLFGWLSDKMGASRSCSRASHSRS